MKDETTTYQEMLAIVEAKLAEQGIANYVTFPGNDCVCVRFGRVAAYYIVRDGRVVDIQID